MKFNIIHSALIPFAMCFFLALALYPYNHIDAEKYTTTGLDLFYHRPEVDADLLLAFSEESDRISSPSFVLDKDFHGFKEALAFKESRGNYFSVNSYGYMGKYQFGKETLKLIGIYNTELFLSDPKLQEKAFVANTQRNKWILRKDIKEFEGKVIKGIEVTESGILAAAHLAGPGSVQKFLRTYGRYNVKDGYGSTLSSYLKKFSGYDTSYIEAQKRPRVSI